MPRLQRSYCFLRFLMLLLSGLIFVSGFSLFGLGVWVRYGAAAFIQVMGSFSEPLVTGSYICMGVGGGLCILGLIGTAGAWKEHRCLIMLVNLLISGASKKSLLTSYIGPTSADPISATWNAIMIQYKCCGFDNSTEDFKLSVFSHNTGLLYPKTCCVDMSDITCDGTATDAHLLHKKSCRAKLIKMIQEKSFIIGSTVAGICVMELFSMIVSVVLFVRLGSAFF
ncbi:tetraspanin-16-like [Aplochiton taeniatus]